jgi:hypothetical protein
MFERESEENWLPSHWISPRLLQPEVERLVSLLFEHTNISNFELPVIERLVRALPEQYSSSNFALLLQSSV